MDAPVKMLRCLLEKTEPETPEHDPPYTRLHMVSRDGLYFHLSKWVLPGMFAAFGFYLQSAGLHYATYSYVHNMMKMKNSSRYDLLYSVLPDPVEEYFPLMTNANSYIHTLDTVAVIFPFLFMVFSFIDLGRNIWAIKHKRADQVLTLQTWTKVMVCAGLLFGLKGALGAMTTVPDSSGWAVCVARLTKDGVSKEGLNWMQEEHTAGEMFSVDFVFAWLYPSAFPLRYCSDMLYSGHTFVVTLFALGAYEQLRIVLETIDSTRLKNTDQKKNQRNVLIFKFVMLNLLAACAIGEQMAEIYFVELTRFHYTMDVVTAIVMVFLVFTNGPIVIFAKQWELRGAWLLIAKYPKTEHQNQTAKKQEEQRHQGMWISRGDIFIPPCCVPCCMFSGREHAYSDEMINKIYRHTFESKCENEEQQKALEKQLLILKGEMNMEEGISMADLRILAGMDQRRAVCGSQGAAASQQSMDTR